MKKAILAAAMLVCAVAAWGGMGVLWSTGGGWVVEPGGDLNVGPGAAANGAVTWQLIYAGENDQIDEIDCGSEHGLGGDDELLAERVVPAGGGAAADGTVWDVWVMAEEGFFTYENAEWTKTGHVFQRMLLGTPEPGAAYAETGLFAYNLGYKNGTEGGDPPDLFYFDPAGNGVSLDRTIPGTGYDLWVGGVQVTEGNAGDIFGDGTARFEGTATNGTLALSNAVVTNAYVFASPNSANLYAGEGFDLTVRVEGSNRLANTAADGYAVYAGGALAITGDGVLVGEEGMSGIVARGNLSIDGATVVAKGGTTGLAGSNVAISNATVHAAGWARGVGIPSGGNVSIVDSKVVATGKAGGVSISGALSVEGASQLEAEATMAGGVAVDADGGITIGEGLAVVVPVGGGRSADGRSIVDAEGNAAGRAAIAAAGSLVGSGTEADPYVIYDYGTLVAFARAVNGGQFDAWGVLAADIAATEADWVPIGIGTNTIYYTGTFDGAGHTISGLANAGTPNDAGLFGFVDSGGVVRNVRLAGVAFNGALAAGGVAGVNCGTVSNCCVSGSVRAQATAGGVAGFNLGTIANCYNTGAVSGRSGAGGVVGQNGYGGWVQNCHSSGEVSDGASGGVVGFNDGTVENSYCSKGPPIGVDFNGTVSGECKALGTWKYTQAESFKRWNFNTVWAMGAAGPYLRVLGERVEYPVWVDGVQVTDANSGDILGDGTARFAGTMSWGTLMLTDAVITNAVKYNSGSEVTAGIYAGNGFDLTISLEGSNRVENATEYGVGDGILAEGNLSLGGTGSLTAEAGSSAHGIYANGNLRIEDATVAASGLYGLCSRKNIVFTNTTVTATGAFDAISANGSATFAGESRVEATATWSGQDGVFADGGITVGEELHLIEPVGGSVSGGGVVDAAGKTAAHVLVAYFYELTIDNGSTTNQITAAGFDIDITADEPQDGEAFVQWSSNVEGLEFDDRDAPETRFTMPATNVTVTARYAIVPEVAVSCAVGGAGGTNDEMTVTVAGPADCDGVADVAVYADETGAGEPVWATNGVALAAGRAEFTVSPAGGVVPAEHVFATYLPNDRYAGATASNRVMGTSAMAIGADDAYDGDDVTVVATLGHDDCTGTVTVDVGGDAYIEAVENGAVTLVIQGLAAGDYDATATYSGDGKYLAASTNVSFTVFPRQGQEEVDGVVWYYAAHGDGTAMVTGVASNHATGNLTMPETLGGWTVTEVGGDAFMQCTNITGMAIAGGVTNIMGDAFAFCMGLTDMTIPDAVTDIGRYAFEGCLGLTNVTVGAGVTNIEDRAFYECAILATVSLPEGLVSIGDRAFEHNALADLRIPDSVADIGEKAFDLSGFLTNVWLGTGIESVGENAFATCPYLAAVWVPVEQEGTGLLDAAGLPAGCEIHYYGTQTVTFDPNGGTCATATNAYAIGEAYGALPEAGRDGHDFAGWWDDAAGVEVTTNSIVTEKAARTLVAHWKEGAVTYWDPVAGTNGVCTNYTAYTGQTTLGSGWYVVTGAITNDGRIGIDRWERNAEVNLILRDGAELVAKGGIEVAGAPEHHLVVWAQSDGPGAGKLTATAGDGSAGIGGTRDSNSAADGFKHVYGGRVTINGGAVTATGGSSGGAGIGGGQDQECEWVTVNGGTVEAIGGGTGGRAIGNGGSRSTYPAVMALHAGAKVLAGDDAAGAAPVAAPNRVAACLEEMYAKIGPCGPHEYEGGACKWCGAEDPLKQIVAEVTGWEGTYDGAGHGVTVRVEEPASGARVRYRAGAPGAGEQTEAWSESPVLFTNACNNAAVSVEISAEGYRTVTNHAAVTIRPAALAVTAKDQEYVYNGRPQGEGDTIYDDPVQIAAKVEAAGLKGEDRIGSVELDGQATDIGIYEDLVQVVWARVSNGTNDVTENYEIGYARGTLTIASPWQTVTFDPGEGTCGTETNQYRWLGRYGWLPEAARTLYTFDGWWATNEAGWARVGTDDRVTKSFERTLVARWLEGVATNGVRWLCATNGEGTVEVTGAVPAEGDLVMPETLDGYTVTAVGGGAFRDCTNITGMAIPAGVTEIGSKAFMECTALTNVTLGAGVTNIGDNAFEGCTSLASVAFPEGLAGIEQGAFLGSALTDAKLPDTTERIGEDVFAGCKALTNVWLGTGIESVGVFAFHLSTNLAAVWVPVEKAGTDLLEEARVPAGCEIHYYGTQTVTFDANGGTCSVATNGYVIGAPYGELPEATRKLHTFEGWQGTNGAPVAATDPVTEEAERTLVAAWTNGVVVGNVLWLCETNADGTVTVTGAEPAEGDLVMPDELDGYAVTAVGEDAFRWCTNLTGMTIAAGVTNLAADAFLNCTALGEMAIPDGVTDIGPYAFCGCDGLTNLTIGAGVTNIAENAFDWCTSLESVALPEGLASLGAWAFGYAPLAEVRIPDATVNIGSNAFYGNGALATVWLGTGIESVGEEAFLYCTNLATIWVPIGQAGTGLLDAAGLPEGCEIHYYGTQTVTFAANGGTCGTATAEYGIGGPYGALPEAAWEGHTFLGWWATNAAGEVEVTTNSVVTEEAARTLTARWRPNELSLSVQAGRWGRAVAVVGGRTNVVAGGTATNLSVAWGTKVSVRGVPDAGFALEGAGTAEWAALTNAASASFAFRPNPTAALRWKYARNANGWFCAQVAIPWHAGYGEALGNLRFLFADRTDAAGKATAYLVDTGTVFGALGRVETHEGRKYRAAGIDTKGFASLSGGKRAVFGVGDATMKSSLASVPKEERKIALRVVNRDIDTVKPLGDKVGFLAWETGGTTRYLAISPDGTAAARGVRRSLGDFEGLEEEPLPPVVVAARSYTVSFDANGGKGTMAKQSMTCGKSAKLRKNAFKRSGWVFVGWATGKNGKVVYPDQAKVKDLRTDGNTATLYAKWAKKAYTVAFNANGGKGKMAKQSMTYGKSAKLRKNAFKRKGWTFVGWAKSKSGAVAYKNRQSVKNLRTDGKTTTLYAKWARKTYTVAFNANGGKGKMARQTMAYGKAAKLRKNAFTSDGRVFLGWATSQDGPVLYADRATVKNLRADGKTKTLYAKWGKSAVKSEKRKVKRGNGVVVTTSDGSDGSAVADGDEGTSWSPAGTGWAWVVLTLPEALDAADVAVAGDHLPEGMRILLSEDAAEWRETAKGRARYVWVAFPVDGEETPAVREIRVTEAAATARKER